MALLLLQLVAFNLFGSLDKECSHCDFNKIDGAHSFVDCGSFGGDLCLMLAAPRTLLFRLNNN